MVLYVCRARPGHMPSYAALASGGAEDSGRRALVEATLDLSGAFNFGQFLQGAPARAPGSGVLERASASSVILNDVHFCRDSERCIRASVSELCY